jgi:hypothetical protein
LHAKYHLIKTFSTGDDLWERNGFPDAHGSEHSQRNLTGVDPLRLAD